METKNRAIFINIVVAVLAFCAFLPAKAQFRYGPTVGVDITSLHFRQDLITIDNALGYSAGITAEMMFPGIGFGLDLSAVYSLRGAKLSMGEKLMWEWQGYGTERTKLHYLSIPIHLRYKYTRLNGLEEKIAPFAFAGPNFGFLVGHNKIEALEYAGGEVGVDVGVGVELLEKIQVSCGYTWGMTYALKAKILTDYSARNRAWMVRAAWLF